MREGSVARSTTTRRGFVTRGGVLWLSFGLLICTGCAGSNAKLEARLTAILADQEDAWNRGDIDRFMTHYLRSDELTFSSSGQTQRGWNATYERYRKRYPTPERMGHLSFDGLEFRRLGPRAVLVLGRWRLERDPDPVAGNFSLVFEKRGDWVIVHDHTSVLPPQ